MIDSSAVLADLEQLRSLTADENGAQRLAWSPVWLRARAWFEEKLRGLPVEHHYDAAGNHWVTLPGDSDRALVLGGHLDSVPNGGWLDGCLGVLTSLANPEVSIRKAQRSSALHASSSSTGRTRRARASAAASSDRPPSPAPRRSMPTATARTAREPRSKPRSRPAVSLSTALARQRQSARTLPRISNCTLSKGPSSSA